MVWNILKVAAWAWIIAFFAVALGSFAYGLATDRHARFAALATALISSPLACYAFLAWRYVREQEERRRGPKG